MREVPRRRIERVNSVASANPQRATPVFEQCMNGIGCEAAAVLIVVVIASDVASSRIEACEARFACADPQIAAGSFEVKRSRTRHSRIERGACARGERFE